jgi:hypothetical protein
MIILAALGSYLGSVRSVNRIEVSVAELYGRLQKDMMIELSGMRTDIAKISTSADGLLRWVTEISHGNSPHVAEIRTTIVDHGKRLDDHEERIGGIEIECARQHTGFKLERGNK